MINFTKNLKLKEEFYFKFVFLIRSNAILAIYADGSKQWLVDDNQHCMDISTINRHRINGPAVKWADGTKQWLTNGKLHRTDGPAIEYADGRKEWWINGKRVK